MREQQWLLALEQEGENDSRPHQHKPAQKHSHSFDPFFNRKHINILAPFANILENDSFPSSISWLNAKSILSTIDTRLQEGREVTRYCIGLLIFLGLLGTFWGLSQTVIGISGVISGLDMNGADVKQAFQTLKSGLNSPLKGMGTAFSCSMFGLAGSLILGFLDLQVSRACTIFHNQIEDRLSTLTKFSSFSAYHMDSSSSGQAPSSAYSLTLLEQTIEGMSALQELLKKSEDSRVTMMKSVQLFSEKLSEMSEYMMAHQGFSQRLAQHQVELQEILIAMSKDGSRGRFEEIVKAHIRSIDATVSKILEDGIEGRAKSTHELRQEIRMISKTLNTIASEQDFSQG